MFILLLYLNLVWFILVKLVSGTLVWRGSIHDLILVLTHP